MLLDEGPQPGHLGDVDPLHLGEVAGQLREAAGHGEHRQAAHRRPPFARELFQELDPVHQVVDVRGDLDAGLTERHVVHPGVAGERAGVGGRHSLGPLAAPQFERDDGLAGLQAAPCRGEERLGPADLFQSQGDDAGTRVGGEVVEVVREVGHGLVAGGDEQVEADAAGPPGRGRHRLDHGAAVGDGRQPARPTLEGREHRQVEAAGDVDQADPVGAHQGHAGLPGRRHHPPLQLGSFLPRLREAAGDGDHASGAGLGRLLDHVDGPLGADRAEHGVHRPPDGPQVGDDRVTEDLGGPGVDEAELGVARQGPAYPGAELGGVADPHDRDGPGVEQPVEAGGGLGARLGGGVGTGCGARRVDGHVRH
nr:hypothetical protein [Streptomyces sp. alain-838]